MPKLKIEEWMPSKNSSVFAGGVFIPAISLGLKDAFSPRFLTAFLMFFLILTLVKNTKRYVKWFGLAYILVFIFYIFLELLGTFDFLVSWRWFEVSITVANSVLAVGFVLLGAIHFFDWLDFQKHKDVSRFKLKAPFDAQKSNLSGKKVRIPIFSGMVMFSFIAAFVYVLGLYWPNDYYLNLMFYLGLFEGQLKISLLSFFLYAFCVCLPMFCVWFLMLKNKNLTTDLSKISAIKVILAALFLSTGVGVLYVMLV